MKCKPDETKDNVLYAFSVEPNRDTATLEEYLQKYPQYRDELIDISIALISSSDQDFIPVSNSKSADLAWDKYQSSLLSSDPIFRPNKIENPLLNLDRKSFKALAKNLGINTLFLAMLRDKTIKLSTIPTKFIRILAKELDISSDVMRSSLEGEPTVSSTVRFKADGKPTATEQVSFDEAMDSCSLSESQKEKLTEMKD